MSYTNKQLIRAIWKAAPEDFRARALALRERMSRFQWELGDMVNELYIYVRENRLEAQKIHCAVTVAVMIDDSNHSPNTLLYYAQVAQFFPPSLDSKGPRELYHMLPFSHFSVAKKFGADCGTALQTSLRMTEARYGIPPSAKKLEKECDKVILGIENPNMPLDDTESDSPDICDLGIPSQAGTPSRPGAPAPVTIAPDETTALLFSEVMQLLGALKERFIQLGMDEVVPSLVALQNQVSHEVRAKALTEILEIE